MTKFIATVCLPPTKLRKLGQAIVAAMAPYDHNLTDDRNPVGQWDWWATDANTQSPYLALPAHARNRKLIRASTVPGRDPGLTPLGPLECYGGPRGLLDFDAMRQREAHRHDALRAAWEELTAQHPPARPLTEFVARHESDPDGYSMEDAKRDHLLQPLVQAVAQRAVAGDDPYFGMSFLLNDPVAYFAQEHDEIREAAVRCAVPGFALLTLDGTWMDADASGYWERANGCLDSLPAEAVVVDVLCHC
ncbi:hypothetical protein GCM10022403_065040 [Streptomyces coacervatus]|uniref:Uncharacterized protein n=1 Tax=Streptomyces coacervatus TaxID=647381 RepID=A0ABP7IN10_9ACTN|nr:hypothetical protein [Streptomyces coacervatus]MDF2268696.1 hypothetical protein [Streptomyces coacervatus]